VLRGIRLVEEKRNKRKYLLPKEKSALNNAKEEVDHIMLMKRLAKENTPNADVGMAFTSRSKN
jgi:hypothetical protein